MTMSIITITSMMKNVSVTITSIITMITTKNASATTTSIITMITTKSASATTTNIITTMITMKNASATIMSITIIMTMTRSVSAAVMITTTITTMPMKFSSAGAVRLRKNTAVKNWKRSLPSFPKTVTSTVSFCVPKACCRMLPENGIISIWYRRKPRSVQAHRNLRAVSA